MAGYALMVIESDYWTDSRLDQALSVIKRTSAVSITLATLVFVLSAVGIALSTQDMYVLMSLFVATSTSFQLLHPVSFSFHPFLPPLLHFSNIGILVHMRL